MGYFAENFNYQLLSELQLFKKKNNDNNSNDDKLDRLAKARKELERKNKENDNAYNAMMNSTNRLMNKK